MQLAFPVFGRFVGGRLGWLTALDLGRAGK